MTKFNSVFVHCVEDANLYGKYGYFSDNIDKLISYVINNHKPFWGKLSVDSSTDDSFPFVREENDTHYRFFYHDPDLYMGMSVSSGRVATYRELAQWLAQGNGEGFHTTFSNSPHLTFTELRYLPVDGNQPVQDIMVRKWTDDEWNIPTSCYLGLEFKKED